MWDGNWSGACQWSRGLVCIGSWRWFPGVCVCVCQVQGLLFCTCLLDVQPDCWAQRLALNVKTGRIMWSHTCQWYDITCVYVMCICTPNVRMVSDHFCYSWLICMPPAVDTCVWLGCLGPLSTLDTKPSNYSLYKLYPHTTIMHDML